VKGKEKDKLIGREPSNCAGQIDNGLSRTARIPIVLSPNLISLKKEKEGKEGGKGKKGGKGGGNRRSLKGMSPGLRSLYRS